MRKRTLIMAFFLALLMVIQVAPAAWGSIDFQTNTDKGIVRITGQGDPGTMIAFLVTESATGARRYLEQTKADSTGSFNLTIPLVGNTYSIQATGSGAAATAQVEVPVSEGGGGGGGQVTIISSLTVVGDSQRGVILPRTYQEIPQGRQVSALDLLKNVLNTAGISYEIKSNGYISSIGGLKEKDRGALSGWMFRINGSFPQVPAEDYVVHDGDFLEFVYTCDGGKDVGDVNQSAAIEEIPEIIPEKLPEKIEQVEEKPIPMSELTAEEAFEELTRRGIIKGTIRGLEPERIINRAEFLTLLSRAGAFNTVASRVPTFTDVRPGQWFYEFIEGAVQAGIISGCGLGRFQPEQLINRYQAAAVLRNLGGIETDNQLTSLDYEQMPEWAKPGCRYALNSGLMSNFPEGSFQGSKFISRLEAADMVWRYMVKTTPKES